MTDGAGSTSWLVLAAFLTQWKIGLVTFVCRCSSRMVYVHSLKPQYVAAATFLPQRAAIWKLQASTPS